MAQTIIQSVRKYKHSGSGDAMDIVIEPAPPKPEPTASVIKRELGDFRNFSMAGNALMHDHHDFEDDDDDPNKFDRLPLLTFNMDWLDQDPEEKPKPEHPFESYILPPAVIRLGKSQKEDLKQAFDLFDDGTGLMDEADMDVALHALDLHLPKPVVRKMVKKIETTKSGRLCFSEFMHFFETELSKRETREDITGSFHHFDRDGRGKITVDNLREVGKAIGEYVDEVEAQDMISGADRDGDRMVNFDEFRKIIQRTTIIPPRPKRKY